MFHSDMLPVILAIVAGIAFWTVLIVLMVKLVFGPMFSGHRGNWGKLKERFGVEVAPTPDRVFGGETAQVGVVRAKNCAVIGVGPRGLALKVPWHSPILIPWSEIHPAGEVTVSWRKAHRLAIGEPTVATMILSAHVFEAMRPYLAVPKQVPIPPLMPLANA